MAVVAAAGLLAAACGGGSKKSSTAGATTSTSEEVTTTTATPSASGQAESTSTTAAAAASSSSGGGTATTAKKATTATTAKKNVVAPSTGSKGVTAAPTAGIQQVTGTTAPNTAAQPGGTITWLKAGEIPGCDPINMANSGASDGPCGMAVMDVLVYSDGGVIKPQTAVSLTSTDAVAWTLKLHPNIKFSDGTPYDAAAVKFNMLRLQDPNNHATRAPQANLIGTMDVVDSTTLRFNLKAKNALFPIALALIPFVGSPQAIQQEGNDKFNNAPIGAGPYVMQSWTRDSDMVLVRNPNYWNAPLPYVDKMILKPITDETQRINTFCAGQATMTYVGSVLNADQMTKQNCGTINPLVLNGGTVLFFNTTKAPMNDPVLRKAIGEALDPVDYSKVVTNNLIAPTKSIFRQDSPFYDPNILQPAFNATDAQKLFDQAAANAGVSTINIPMGTFPVTNYQATAQYVQGKLNGYNHIHVDLTTEASAAHITNCTQRQYTGICVFGNIFDDPDPTWTGQFVCNAATNPTGYCNPKFDSDVADNEVTLDPNQRVADLKDAQKQFYGDLPALFMEQRYSWVFTNPSIQDFHFANDGLPLLDRFWIKQR